MLFNHLRFSNNIAKRPTAEVALSASFRIRTSPPSRRRWRKRWCARPNREPARPNRTATRTRDLRTTGVLSETNCHFSFCKNLILKNPTLLCSVFAIARYSMFGLSAKNLKCVSDNCSRIKMLLLIDMRLIVNPIPQKRSNGRCKCGLSRMRCSHFSIQNVPRRSGNDHADEHGEQRGPELG